MISFRVVAQWLGRISGARLVIAYGLTSGAAMGAVMYGANAHDDLLVRVGALVATALTAVLFTVTTWYRRENVINAAILLALAWTLARMIGVCSATLLLWRTLGGMGFALIGVLFGVPVGVLVAILIAGVLVAVLRRIRPPFTSSTLREGDPGAN